MNQPLCYGPEDEKALARAKSEFRFLLEGLIMLDKTAGTLAMRAGRSVAEYSDALVLALVLFATRTVMSEQVANDQPKFPREQFLALTEKCIAHGEQEMQELLMRVQVASNTGGEEDGTRY